MLHEPVGTGPNSRIIRRNPDGPKADDGLPRAIDIVHAPAAKPAAIRLLTLAKVGDPAVDRGMADPQTDSPEGLEGTTGEVRYIVNTAASNSVTVSRSAGFLTPAASRTLDGYDVLQIICLTGGANSIWAEVSYANNS
jgi:hypothetical protein